LACVMITTESGSLTNRESPLGLLAGSEIVTEVGTYLGRHLCIFSLPHSTIRIANTFIAIRIFSLTLSTTTLFYPANSNLILSNRRNTTCTASRKLN
jgi:hypothetical protein